MTGCRSNQEDALMSRCLLLSAPDAEGKCRFRFGPVVNNVTVSAKPPAEADDVGDDAVWPAKRVRGA